MRSSSHDIHKQIRNRFGFSESWRISCGPMRNGFHAMLKIIENQTNCHKLFSICRNKINAFELNEVVINESSLRAVIEYVEEIPRKTIFLFDFPDMPTRLTHTNVACTVASVICSRLSSSNFMTGQRWRLMEYAIEKYFHMRLSDQSTESEMKWLKVLDKKHQRGKSCFRHRINEDV